MKMDGYESKPIVPFVGMIIHGCLCWIYLAGHQGTSSMAISGTDLLEAFAKFYGFIWGSTSILGFRISHLSWLIIIHYLTGA